VIFAWSKRLPAWEGKAAPAAVFLSPVARDYPNRALDGFFRPSRCRFEKSRRSCDPSFRKRFLTVWFSSDQKSMYAFSDPTRKRKSVVLFLPRERKPIASRCARRHTWLYGATLARLWSKVPRKVALSYIFAFGERSLYCSSSLFQEPMEVLHRACISPARGNNGSGSADFSTPLKAIMSTT
jgi:hypothetical protein